MVALEPLAAAHEGTLVQAAADGELWQLKVTVVPDAAGVGAYVRHALEGQAGGTVLPFVVVDRGQNRVVGSTRFWKIDRLNRGVEIGHTWLARSVQGSGVNAESKYLMLCHAFETMGMIRVQFSTDVLNEHSRAAIRRLGAVEEGTIRYERIMPDGRRRDSVRFSIIEPEWPAVKAGLEWRMTHELIRPTKRT